MPRRLIFPEPMSYAEPRTNTSEPWGLSDLIVEKALANPDLLTSVENCNRVIGLLEKFRGFRSKTQTGKALVLGDSDYEFVKIALGLCLQKFARESGGALPLEFVSDISVYMRAFHQAEVVRENDSPSSGASAPAGVA